jgi:hypothetical protein
MVQPDNTILFSFQTMLNINGTTMTNDCIELLPIDIQLFTNKMNALLFSNQVFETCLFDMSDRININNCELQTQYIMPFMTNDKIQLNGTIYLNMIQFCYSFSILI